MYLFAAISYGPAESDNQILDAKVGTARGLITLRNVLRVRYTCTSREIAISTVNDNDTSNLLEGGGRGKPFLVYLYK